MIEYEELKFRLLESEPTIKNLKEALAIDSLIGEVERLEELSAAPDFWDKPRGGRGRRCEKRYIGSWGRPALRADPANTPPWPCPAAHTKS